MEDHTGLAGHRAMNGPDSRSSRRKYLAGAGAGLMAGTVMAMAMMMLALFRNQSIWTMPNLIAAIWLGPDVATGQLGFPTFAGFLTHEVTSTLMGVIALAWVAGLEGRRLLLASLAYALASYPLVFSAVISWANPVMYERTSMIVMTGAHLLYGIVFAAGYSLFLGKRNKSTA